MYKGKHALPGYPRNVDEMGIPHDIDAVVPLRRYNTTYFFKDHQVGATYNVYYRIFHNVFWLKYRNQTTFHLECKCLDRAFVRNPTPNEKQSQNNG